MQLAEIWKPRIRINGNHRNDFVSPEEAHVDHQGQVMLNYKFIYDGFCMIESEFFPYDSHLCFIYLDQLTNHVTLLPMSYEDENGETVVFMRPEVNEVIEKHHNSWWIR